MIDGPDEGVLTRLIVADSDGHQFIPGEAMDRILTTPIIVSIRPHSLLLHHLQMMTKFTYQIVGETSAASAFVFTIFIEHLKYSCFAYHKSRYLNEDKLPSHPSPSL